MKVSIKWLAGALFAALVLASVPAIAETYGTSGEIESIDSTSRSLIVGKYKVYVVNSSEMIDANGNSINFDGLSGIDSTVGLTMNKSGPRWELIRLVVEEPDEDE